MASVAVIGVALSVAVPQGTARPGGPNEFPLLSLWEFLAAHPVWASANPYQPPVAERGGPTNGPHLVPGDATRANKGSGSKPTKAPGSLDEYRAPARRPDGEWTSPKAKKGFDPATSRLSQSGTSEFVSVFDNADGSATSRFSQVRMNFKGADGVWRPIQTRLVRGADGRWHSVANDLAVAFPRADVQPRNDAPLGAAPASAGEELASLDLPTGQTFAYELDGSTIGAPQVFGAMARYSDALTDMDVELVAATDGIEETLVLKDRPASNSWVFPLRLKGLTPSMQADGSVVLRDRSGAPLLVIPRAFMQDSRVQPDGDFTYSDAVTYELITVRGKPALKVTADRSWLDDPARVYPVRIDPSAVTWDNLNDLYVDATGVRQVDSLGVGCYMAVSTCDRRRSFLKFNYYDLAYGAPGNNLGGVYVTSAQLTLWHTWSEDCDHHSKVYAYRVTQPWTASTIGAYPGASVNPTPIGELLITDNHPACTNTGGDRSINHPWTMNITDLSIFHDWSRDSSTNNGIALGSEDDNDRWGWKRFVSRHYDPGGGLYSPQLDVTWQPNQAPQVDRQYPPNGYAATTLTPELIASATDVDNWPNPLTYRFSLYDNANPPVLVDSRNFSSSTSWVVPAAKLAWGNTYWWTVEAYDGLNVSAPVWHALSTPVPQPPITSQLSSNGGRGFNELIGNYTTSATDAKVATVGPPLAVQRFYNSRDPRVGSAFGTGWSSLLDAKAKLSQYAGDAPGVLRIVTLTYPSGQDVAFGLNADGTFSAGSGRYSVLSCVDTTPNKASIVCPASVTSATIGGFRLTDKDGTRFLFTTSGGTDPNIFRLTSVTDAQGRLLTLSYNGSGQVTSLISTSGRKLYLTWATPAGAASAHVSTVYTDPAGGAGTESTWLYSYTGDRLTGVCDPVYYFYYSCGTRSTVYTYGSNSLYPTVVNDLGPHTYLRLGETSGTFADSAAKDNVDYATGTYSGVTLGATGPLPGSTAKAASFTGSTSSKVELTTKRVALGASYQSVSMWFKTSTPNGVLLSYQKDAVTTGVTTPGNYTPTLYIGSSGKLYGEFWHVWGINTMSSAGSVADNQWHHVVLTGGGDTQTLYLDGAPIGTKGGQILLLSPESTTHQVIGAGFLGGGWPDQPHQSTDNTGYATFFNGQISDFAFYDRPLRADQVTALRQAGLAASTPLTRVTRPSGANAIDADISYDPATGLVSQVTDGNGGVWQIGTPQLGQPSMVYASQVLAAGPTDYYRLADSHAFKPVNEIATGGTGRYNVVVQNVTNGPFGTDGPTVAGFDGSHSYVELPAAHALKTGPNSVSLWFKLNAGGSGVLYGYQDHTADQVSTSQKWVPALYVGTDGYLRGELLWIGNMTPITTSTRVDDGLWHHVALTATSTLQTMYLDGNKVGTLSGTSSDQGTAHAQLGLGSVLWWPGGGSTAAYWPGQIAEFAMFNKELSPEQAKAQFDARNAAGTFGTWGYPVKTVSVTLTSETPHIITTNAYDIQAGGRLVATIGPYEDVVSPIKGLTQYRYDVGGFQYSVTDPLGNTTTTQHDVRGNVIASITCQYQVNDNCSTTSYTYYAAPDAKNPPPDPRNDMVTAVTDPNNHTTSYTYDGTGNRLTTTDPLTRVTSIDYTDGLTTTGGAGVVPPAGLPWRVRTAAGAISTTAYFANGDVESTTDAAGLKTVRAYDGLGRVISADQQSDTYPHLTTGYTYDRLSRLQTQTDPIVVNRIAGTHRAAMTTTSYDYDGHVAWVRVEDLTSGGDASRTTYKTYNDQGLLATVQDAAGFTTSYTYDTRGNRKTQTVPVGTAAAPKTVTNSYKYDALGHPTLTTLNAWTDDPNSPMAPIDKDIESRAYDLAGRLASVTDAQGFVTSYTYTDNNLRVSTTRTKPSAPTASFVAETLGYDPAGNVTSKVTNNGRTTTTFTIDDAGRTNSTTIDPSGVNRTTTLTLAPDDTVVSTTVSDGTGIKSSVDQAYDVAGRMVSQTVYSGNLSTPTPVGRWRLNETSGSTFADTAGNTAGTTTNVTWASDPTRGQVASFNGTSSLAVLATPIVDTTRAFTMSTWVKMSTKDATRYIFSMPGMSGASAFKLSYQYPADKWRAEMAVLKPDGSVGWIIAETAAGIPQSGVWVNLIATGDPATGALRLYVNAAQQASATTTYKFNNHPIGLRIGDSYGTLFFNGSISDVQAYQKALSTSDITAIYNGTAPSSSAKTIRTSWQRDRRGLTKSQTDPLGNATYFDYDEAGRLAAATYPSVMAEENGGTPVFTAPMAFTGYNTFGEKVETKDPKGRHVVIGRDAAGNAYSVTKPAYTPPGGSPIPAGTTTSTFYANGLVKDVTDPTGNVTSYVYDQLGRVANTTAPDTGVTRVSYDMLGHVTSQTDPTGGRKEATYDYLGRTTAATLLETKPSVATYPTEYTYNDTVGTGGGFLGTLKPPGLNPTTYVYNNVGEVTSATDGANHTTSYAYDFAGRATTKTLHDLSKTVSTYDSAGNVVQQQDYNPAGAVINTVSATYDNAGHNTSTTDGNGHTTNFIYNALGWLTQQVEPVSGAAGITSTFGYNVAGERTRFTDGRGIAFITTYNSWGLPESTIEPQTNAYPAVADRTFTTAYNAAGQPSVLTMPGGVSITNTYTNGRLTRQAGAGAEAATTDRVFTYDLAGRVKTVAADGGTNTLSYNDRGQLLSTSWANGNSTFTYDNADGSLHTRTDAAGATTYTIDTIGRLSGISNTTTGVQADYTYDNLNRASLITYGGTGNQRQFTYDTTNRTLVDDLRTPGPSGTSIAKIAYGFDHNGNETSKTTTGFAGAAANTYTYDWANRLTSWTAGSTTTNYDYDNAGNRTHVGGRDFQYDQRNQLTGSQTSGTSYAYTKRGTLASSTTGSVTLNTQSDAFGQVSRQYTSATAYQSYIYDGLGRAIKSGFSYTGVGNTLAADGTANYTRDPNGSLVGVKQSATCVLAWTDLHADVVGLFSPSGATLNGSTAYDPLGKTLAASGMMGNLGYQSGWTEAATGRVNMHSRWYNNDTGQFDTRDTASNAPTPASTGANRFGYANGNPLTGIDADGHKPMFDDYEDFKAWNATQNASTSSKPPRSGCRTDNSCSQYVPDCGNPQPAMRPANCPTAPSSSCNNAAPSMRSASCPPPPPPLLTPKDGNASSCRTDACTTQYIVQCDESIKCLNYMFAPLPIRPTTTLSGIDLDVRLLEYAGGDTSCWDSELCSDIRAFTPQIIKFAKEAGIDPRVLLSILLIEGSGSAGARPFANLLDFGKWALDGIGLYVPLKSKIGLAETGPSLGWANIQEETFYETQKRHLEVLGGVEWTDVLDPETGIKVAAYHLKDLEDRVMETATPQMGHRYTVEEMAAAAYNVGTPRLAKAMTDGHFGDKGTSYISGFDDSFGVADQLICHSGIWVC